MNAKAPQKGDASVLLILGILVLIVGMTGALYAASTAAVVTETDRYALDRAKLNARNGAVEMDEFLQPEISAAIGELIEQAVDDGAVFGAGNFATLEFPVYEREFEMNGTGATEADRAAVSATVALAGPPQVRSVGGPSSDTAPTRLEEYRFRVRMRSTGYSWGGAVATYEHESDLVIEVEIGPEP